MVKDDQTSIDDLVGMLLQEEARLEYGHLRQSPVTSPSLPTSSIPLDLNVNQHQYRSPSTGYGSSSNTGSMFHSNEYHCRRPQKLCSKPGHEAVD